MSALDSETTLTAATEQRRQRTALEKLARHPAGPVAGHYAVTLLTCVVFGLAYPNDFAFLSRENVVVNLRAIPLLGVLGLGVGLLMISGEFDLSVGSVYTLAPMATALAFSEGWPIALAVALALGIALVVGLVNGIVCPSSKQMGLLSVFHKGGSGSSLFDVKPLGFDGSSGGFGWSVF